MNIVYCQASVSKALYSSHSIVKIVDSKLALYSKVWRQKGLYFFFFQHGRVSSGSRDKGACMPARLFLVDPRETICAGGID